jgi:hypothetical protein
MKHATVLLSCLIWVFMLLVPFGRATGADDCNTRTPPADTGTPYLQTQYPSATPWDTATPWPTATWVTPTSPPEETPIGEPTPTVEFAPDPSPSATVTPRSPDGEDEPQPTWDCHNNYDERHCLAQTGGGMPTHVKLALIAIGGVVCVFVIVMARAGRRVR